jgi:hypothetical protein
MEHQINKNRLIILSVGVFLMSFGLLAFEIALARLLSVMLSYHYVFAVVSLSLFGLGAGGIFAHVFQTRASDKPPSLDSLALSAGLCSLTMAFSAIVAIQIGHFDAPGVNVLLYCAIFVPPFFFGGLFLANVFSMFPSLSSVIYGSDLAGAAAGCMGVILALNMVSAVCAIFFFAAITSLSSAIFSIASEVAE